MKKRNFTRQYNACGKITSFASSNQSTDTAANVKKHQEKLDKAYGKYSDAMDSLQLVDPVNMDTYEKAKKENDEKYMVMIERIMATIKDINAPTLSLIHI